MTPIIEERPGRGRRPWPEADDGVALRDLDLILEDRYLSMVYEGPR